jgi:hypothetical protein
MASTLNSQSSAPLSALNGERAPGEVSIPASPGTQPSPLLGQLSLAIGSFIGWLDRVGYESYDPYDLWGTRYGLFARRLYYAKNPAGLPLIAPILAAELICPSIRRLFVRKQRFATADAQLLLAFLNLHSLGSTGASPADAQSLLRLDRGLEVIGNERKEFALGKGSPEPSGRAGRESLGRGEVSKVPQPVGTRLVAPGDDIRGTNGHSHHQPPTSHLSRARALADGLLQTSIPGYRGHCWGYPFDWQNNRGLWRKNTPFITATPYCYDAFVKLWEATGESRYLEVAESAARFVFHDLNDTPTSADAAAGSYGPDDRTFVVNASAYRAWLLFDAAHRFDCPAYHEKAHANLNFILQSQNADGSWLYALNSPAEAFIDHFHTCFNLKNLWRLNLELRDPRVTASIEAGYRYYREALFEEDGLPRSFAIQPRTQIVRLEMYNIAEAITLGTLLRELFPSALEDSQRLAQFLVEEHQVSAGHFSTRVLLGGIRHTFPFLRWPQAQLFYALTNLLRALTRPG